jgi:subtilisin family serine protease
MKILAIIFLVLLKTNSYAQITVVPNLGTKTPNYNTNPLYYDTTEYYTSKANSVIKADIAYSRGWTGKGSIIAVADTGYALNNKDLIGQVIASKDYTGAGINDTNGHGTFVLSEIVALKNNTGIQGVAFDSKAIAIKIGTGSSVSLKNAALGFSWAADQGAIAGNLSANSNYDTTFQKNLVSIGNGVYRSTDTRYNYSKGIFYNGENPLDWKAATDKGLIIVNSAGNQGLAVPNNPGYFATVTDSSGNLLLGGKMLIVGASDNLGNKYSWSNGAGSICQNYNSVTKTCLDKYKISDFYVLAPGMVTSSSLNNGLTTMSGTSMSAPLVTGEIAILNQMWPYMKPENLVQLVLKTANKNIPNYNVNVMGQGMIDLDKATQPVGVVGIPTNGRNVSKVTTTSATVSSGSAVSSIAKSGSVSSVMVVDEFSRDFYMDLNNTITVKDKRKVSDVTVQQNNVTYLPFNQSLGGFEQTREANLLPDLKFGIALNKYNDQVYNNSTTKGDYGSFIQKDWNVDSSFNIRTTFGSLTERNNWLGNETSGALAVGKNNKTYFNQIGLDYVSNDNKFSFDIGRGVTSVNTDSNSLIKSVSNIQSQSYKVGYEKTITDYNKIGLTYSLPNYIVKGSANISVPTATDENGDIVYQNVKNNLKTLTPEKNIGLYYTTLGETDYDWSMKFNTEYRTNIAGQEGKNGLGFGIQIEKTF